MRKYIKPSAEIVELTVKESLSALKQQESKNRTFGFGSNSKSMSLTTYATAEISVIKKVNG